MMSTSRSVASEAYTSTEPSVPAGRMAAFAVMVPVGAFNVEAVGIALPVGQVVIHPSGPCGSAVKFKAYATAPDGTLQPL